MKLKINNYLEINVSEPNELIELMSPEEKLQLIESLSCHDEVIEHVVNQISEIHGRTENGNHGGTSGVLGSSQIDKARIDIAIKSSEMASNIINDLKKEIDRKNDQISELYGEISKLRGY